MKNNTIFTITHVSLSVFDKSVINDVSLSLLAGQVHAIMGPNGSGKSSLAYAIAGHPQYIVTSGSFIINDCDLAALSPRERALKGIFLAFQNPCEIPGVSVLSFLKEAYAAVKQVTISITEFSIILHERCKQLGIDTSFLARGLNEGFSGGEKKKLEILQLLILQPQIAILDEIDSGLDVDALKVVSAGIALARVENPCLSIILITHYQRILRYITPDYVHVLCNGRIVASGDARVADRLESEGYEVFKNGTEQDVSPV